MKIVLDPGHGGSDRFNKGHNGYIEADGVLEMAKALKKQLKNYKCDVFLTRETDRYLSLTHRAKFAVDHDADLFISLHTNAGGGRGTEVYYSVDIPADKIIAAHVSSAIAKEFNLVNRGAKVRESTRYPNEDYYTVIDYSQDHGIKHVLLVEAMFHDNLAEEAILQRPDTMNRIAKVVSSVIAKEFALQEITKLSIEQDLEVIQENLGSIIDAIGRIRAKGV